MKKRLSFYVGFACFATFVSAKPALLEFLVPGPDLNVITVTDVTPAGGQRSAASLANPVYYVAVNAGHNDLGAAVAGDRIPSEAAVNEVMAKVLAKRGFLPATKNNPPTIALFWTWGTLNVLDAADQGAGFGGLEEGAGTVKKPLNHAQLVRFMGGEKVGLAAGDPSTPQMEPIAPNLTQTHAEAELVSDAAMDNLYVIAIGAYDLPAMLKKQKVLLWKTKISAPARGLALDQTLPAMLAIAGPHIGRETVRPVWAEATDKFKADVHIGDAIVVPEGETLPVFDADGPKPDSRKRR